MEAITKKGFLAECSLVSAGKFFGLLNTTQF
jgi:hypothetical protein